MGKLRGAAYDEKVALLNSLLGNTILSLFEREAVSEIEFNNDGLVFVEEGDDVYEIDPVDESTKQAIARVLAEMEDRTITEATPNLAATLPGGQRVQVMIPPASIDGTTMSIRNPARRRYTHEMNLQAKRITQDQVDLIRKALVGWEIQSGPKRGQWYMPTMWIIGGTGSGKSTMGDTIARDPLFAPTPKTRCVVIQDRPELSLENIRNKVMWWQDVLTMRQMCQYSLRMNFTKLILGEVRDDAMYEFVKICNTGHDGNMLTLHANSVEEAFRRAYDLCLESGIKPSMESIMMSVGMIVWMGTGRRVVEVALVENGKTVERA
jgi:pilus assembly protein CpaF